MAQYKQRTPMSAKRAYNDTFDVRLRAKALQHCCAAKAGVCDAYGNAVKLGSQKPG